MRRITIALLALTALLSGCYRGQPTEKPPIHIISDMDEQPKFEAQDYTTFFPNEAVMRVPPAGTLAREWLRGDSAFYTGLDPTTLQPIVQAPVNVTLSGLEQGQGRFNIFCAPCHGRTGDGQGIVAQRGYIPPPTFHSDVMRGYSDGHLFQVITNGIRTMPGYAQQIPVVDRWRIVTYVRALQRSQRASRQDVPEDALRRLQRK
ncbi:MAG: cytochrome c [Candidatus Zixiibacteriota bacterium]|nr:MAG: cytochrome c [candidate division Zixibacteria bacterium]